jgi:hypothetical protein
MYWHLYLWTHLRVRYLVGSCVRWFIGTLPDRPIGLYRLKHEAALQRGLAYLSRCNSGWFCHSAEPRKVSGQIRPAVLNNRHHHLLTLPRLWLGKLNFSTCWYKHSSTSNVNSSEEVVMTSILQWPTIRISSVPNLHFSVRLKNPWTPMLGFIFPN